MSSDNNVGITVSESKGTLADLYERLAGGNGRSWLQALKRFLVKKYPWKETVTTYIELIRAFHYSRVNAMLNPAVMGEESMRIGSTQEVFSFQKDKTTREVIKSLAEAGYRPGTLGDLMKWVSGDENTARGRIKIYALGSVVEIEGGAPLIPYYEEAVGDRELDLAFFGGKDAIWPAGTIFIASTR